MTQAGTGVASFDTPNLLWPMQQRLNTMQLTIEQDKAKLVAEINRDPVPQFSHDQIEAATEFLQSASDAMQSFMDDFKKEALAAMSADRLKQQQEMARESTRQLVLLLADRSVPFNGSSMQGSAVEFQEAQQDHAIQQRMTRLQGFLRTFGQAQWLGQSIVDSSFESKKSIAIDILAGLLSPTKLLHNVADVHKFFYCGCCGKWAYQSTFIQNGGQCPHGCSYYYPYGHICQAQTDEKNPLEQDGCEHTTVSHLKLLSQQCQALAKMLEDDEQTMADMKQRLEKKMAALKAFAHVLNRVPEVLNSYVLVRLSDLGSQDASVLKQWVTHDEATSIHKILDTFKDNAIEEFAFRRLQERSMAVSSGRCSHSSSVGRDYLLLRSVFAEGARDGDAAMEVLSCSSEPAVLEHFEVGDDHSSRGKPSHRQRARKAKFRASIPRTPSSTAVSR